VSPVRYEQGFYISDDGILDSHRRGNLKSYMISVYLQNWNTTKPVRITGISGLCTLSGTLKTGKHSVSEARLVSILSLWEGDTYSVGSHRKS
jgi:hypothetical protein